MGCGSKPNQYIVEGLSAGEAPCSEGGRCLTLTIGFGDARCRWLSPRIAHYRISDQQPASHIRRYLRSPSLGIGGLTSIVWVCGAAGCNSETWHFMGKCCNRCSHSDWQC